MRKKSGLKFLLSATLVVQSLALAPANAAKDKIKYAKSEVEKSVGKCVGAIFGGILVGALAGAATSRNNKKGATTGALVGAGAGAVACAIIRKNAKRKDRIIAAQLAAASSRSSTYLTSFPSDAGDPISFAGQAGPVQMIDAARLRPVKYESMGQDIASPILPDGAQYCREVSSSLGDNTGAREFLPPQIVCRTSDGNWSPYAPKMA